VSIQISGNWSLIHDMTSGVMSQLAVRKKGTCEQLWRLIMQINLIQLATPVDIFSSEIFNTIKAEFSLVLKKYKTP
jgi:hypothetical protein